MVDCGLDVAVVRVVVLTLDREDRDPVLVDERRRDVVLRRQRVGRAEDDVCTTSLQSPGEVRRLGGDVQAGRDADARQRLLPLEALADRGEHRHLPVRPLDPPHAFGGERKVLHVVSLWLPSFLSRSNQATSSFSCFRCSHSTHAGAEEPASGTFVPASHVSTAARTVGVAAKPQRERDLVELDTETPPEIGETLELVQLADAVEAVTARQTAAGTTSPACSR